MTQLGHRRQCGVNSLENASRESVKFLDTRLPHHPLKPIDAKKFKSLKKNYHTIPQDKIHYYPNVSDIIDSDSDKDDTNTDKALSGKRGHNTASKNNRRKLGVVNIHLFIILLFHL